jgi:hypothetical protein
MVEVASIIIMNRDPFEISRSNIDIEETLYDTTCPLPSILRKQKQLFGQTIANME